MRTLILCTADSVPLGAGALLRQCLGARQLEDDIDHLYKNAAVVCSSLSYLDTFIELTGGHSGRFFLQSELNELESKDLTDGQTRYSTQCLCEKIQTELKSPLHQLMFIFTTPHCADLLLHRFVYGKLTLLHNSQTRAFYTTFCHSDGTFTMLTYLPGSRYQMNLFNRAFVPEKSIFSRIRPDKFRKRLPSTPPPSPLSSPAKVSNNASGD